MKKLLVLLLLILSIVCSSVAMPIARAEINAQNETTSTYIPTNMKGEVKLEENTGDFNIVPVNNNVLYPLSGGTWSRFIVSDLNQDGYLDFQVSGNGIGDNGIWNFYGTPESQNPESKDYLVMEGRRKASNNNYLASTPRCIYDDNGNYVKTTLVDRTYIQYDSNVGNYTNIDLSHVYNPLYINGDGDLDMMGDGTYMQGNVKFYENISEKAGEYDFVNRDDVHTRALRLHETTITFCDWNKDGIPDLLTNAECGNMYYLVNNLQTAE